MIDQVLETMVLVVETGIGPATVGTAIEIDMQIDTLVEEIPEILEIDTDHLGRCFRLSLSY